MQLINPANIVFHRVGGLDLTTRFKDGELPIISPKDWKEESSAVEITFSSGAHLQSAVVVREFVPRYGDVTGRRYTDALGNHRWVNLPSYGLVDPSAYLHLVRTRVPEQARAWASTASNAHREALRLIDAGLAPELDTLLCYDFGRYQKTRSAFITGPARLGINQLPGDAKVMPGQSPLPRMITAQCDVVLTSYLAELLLKLFGDGDGPLSKRLLSTALIDTHVGYVALRILTEGTIWVLVDKERRDCENNSQDNSLQVKLQDDLNSVIQTFTSTHYGINYEELEKRLPLEAAAFYDEINSQADIQPVPGPEQWKSALFWLPTLRDAVTKSYHSKQVFTSH